MRRAILSILVLAGCSGGSTDDQEQEDPCNDADVVVTDIDETLTLSDAEWFNQLVLDSTCGG